MSQPAEVTSSYDWDRLNAQLAGLVVDIEDLFERVDDPDRDPIETEEPVPDDHLDRSYVPGRDAELEEDRRLRLDYETDRDLDGDWDRSPDDDPEFGQ